MPATEADIAQNLTKDWAPGFIGPGNPLKSIPSFVTSRLKWSSLWEAIAAIIAPGVSFYLAISNIRSTQGNGMQFHLLVVCAALWAIATLLRWWAYFSSTGPTAQARRAVARMLSQICSHLAPHDDACRATWFRPDDSRNVLVPFARYDPTSRSPAPRSKALYPPRVSYTGLGWAFPDRAIIYQCPTFNSVAEMQLHYRQSIGIHECLLRRISPRMKDVRCILTIGLSRKEVNGAVLGVLSIDFFKEQPSLDGEHLMKLAAFRECLTALANLEIDQQYTITKRVTQ